MFMFKGVDGVFSPLKWGKNSGFSWSAARCHEQSKAGDSNDQSCR